jgi:hypothetical protein
MLVVIGVADQVASTSTPPAKTGVAPNSVPIPAANATGHAALRMNFPTRRPVPSEIVTAPSDCLFVSPTPVLHAFCRLPADSDFQARKFSNRK